MNKLVLLGTSKDGQASQPDVNEVRDQILAIIGEQNDLYQNEDVILIKENEWFVKRFMLEKKRRESAVKVFNQCLLWRKKIGVNSGLKDKIPIEFYSMGLLSAGKDANGFDVAYFRLNMHKVFVEWRETYQKFFAAFIEHMDTKAAGKKWGLVTDFTGATLANSDLINSKFLLDTIFNNYPLGLSYLCLHDPAWYLRPIICSAIGFVPKASQHLIKVTNVKTIRDIIGAQNLPHFMGGPLRVSLDDMVPSDPVCLRELAASRGLSETQVNNFLSFYANNLQIIDSEHKKCKQAL